MTLQIDLSQLYAFASKINGFHQVLGEELKVSGDSASTLTIQQIPNNTSWKNATGTLDNSWTQIKSSEWEAQVGSSVAWAHRREWGFSGMTDSIGRFYPSDPGAFYAQGTIDNNLNNFEQIYIDGIQRALVRLGAV